MAASSAEQFSASAGKPVERISIVVPMRNEATHIEQFVADVAAQDFAGEVEALVADGGSTDGSADILERAAARTGLALTILPNPAGWVSHGLNLCIRRANGDLLVRLDCHSRYPPDYLRHCARAAEESDAEVVGGIVVPEGHTPTERAVAVAMDSPFGGIGWMQHAGQVVRRESDVITYGAFRPGVFERVGLFDESLLRNQDDEFTLRIRRAGGRVLLDSRIRVVYTPRGSYRGVFRQYFQYGFWKVPVMNKHRNVLSGRSLAPVAFLTSVAVLAPAAFLTPVAGALLVVELATYSCGALIFGLRSLRARGEPLSLLPRVLAVYPTFHVAYGLGMLSGLARLVAAPRSYLRRRPGPT